MTMMPFSQEPPGTPRSCILQPPPHQQQQVLVDKDKRSVFAAPKKPNATTTTSSRRRLRLIMEDNMDITMDKEDDDVSSSSRSSNLCYTPKALYSQIPFLKTHRGSAWEALIRIAPHFPDTPLNNSDKAPVATTKNGGLKLQPKRRVNNNNKNHLQKRPRLEEDENEDEDEGQTNMTRHHKHKSKPTLPPARSRSRSSQANIILPEALEAPSPCFLPDIPEKRPTSPQSCLLVNCHSRLPMRQRTAEAAAAVGYSW